LFSIIQKSSLGVASTMVWWQYVIWRGAVNITWNGWM
jgi:hypothetical protein